ncbi:peptidylprolyl isomerase [Janthinobacterium psychrotolerans]|uniref:peptidylprolyl isomerase n=1 Tax=Janthinobacterium psychrotolerans TaxID=1747903 RepID=A0A1A7BWM5_9BURK|nr:peptidylprolyl isomerase [Janthinobacterium psychrotolerans]OBV37912.1 peptidyl-prolyl cis-trans isomerase C [Janthinobacterium psychrotolerans]
MGISVNGVDIDDKEVEQELAHHQDAGNPLKQAVHELVLRRLLVDEAQRLGLCAGSDDELVEALFAQEVKVPVADDAACRTFYAQRPQLFRSGALVEARHILFQVTPEAPLDLLRTTAQAVLDALKAAPERFAELAGQYSNCPSGALGGSLGQLSPGQSVPEFDALVFRLDEGELAGRLLETRFGYHIVQVLRRIEGQPIAYEAVQAQIADRLSRAAWQRAVHQYLHLLVGRATIAGVELEGTDTPLVQ